MFEDKVSDNNAIKFNHGTINEQECKKIIL